MAKPYRPAFYRDPLTFRGGRYVVPDEKPGVMAKMKLDKLNRSVVYILRVRYYGGRREAHRCPDLNSALAKFHDLNTTPDTLGGRDPALTHIENADILRGVGGVVCWTWRKGE